MAEMDWGMELHGNVEDGHIDAFGARAQHLNGDKRCPAVPVCPKCGRSSWRPCLLHADERYLAAVHRECVVRMARRGNIPDRVQVVTMWGGIHPEAACEPCQKAVMNLVSYVFHVAACEAGDRRRIEAA
jgi:hypothetical protein